MGNYFASYKELEGCCCPVYNDFDENGTAIATQSWLREFEPDKDWDGTTLPNNNYHSYYNNNWLNNNNNNWLNNNNNNNNNNIDSRGEWDSELYPTGNCEADPNTYTDDEDGYIHQVEYNGYCYTDQCTHGVLQCSSLGPECYTKISTPFANEASVTNDSLNPITMFIMMGATVYSMLRRR